jgi:DNA-binding NtrC family response regulator
MGADILIVDDDPRISATLAQQLEAFGYRPENAGDGATARQMLQSKDYGLILLDLALPDTNGLQLLEKWKEEGLAAPVIVISGTATVPDAVNAMKQGAADFLVKPIDMQILEAVVQRTFTSHQLRSENLRLRQLTGAEATEFRGSSAPVQALLQDAKKIAVGDHPILLEGETGTGKQVLARYIHEHSNRSGESFVIINCAAITETLFESELFGHEKGAFTGAISRKPGKFELVGKGTLFLDEIGELPVRCQAKLLTAVEDRIYERVGGTRTLDFEGRLIAATNRDLDAEIKKDHFRSDLFYRLGMFRLKLPSLRSRPDDVPIYISWAIEQCRHRHGRNYRMPDGDTMEKLASYPWPGNVRELLHHVERAALLADGPEIKKSLWLSFPSLHTESREKEVDDLRLALNSFKKSHILRVLSSCGGNQTEASRRLGIERTHLNRLLAEFEGRQR